MRYLYSDARKKGPTYWPLLTVQGMVSLSKASARPIAVLIHAGVEGRVQEAKTTCFFLGGVKCDGLGQSHLSSLHVGRCGTQVLPEREKPEQNVEH